ncbi:hypothetical protein ACI48J_22715 [Paenibacillus chitinolyticus]|uniref:hypothetical protein n=1 Tax=Paenibacillus chitinolyticus TaxID=79263 RepID=UPI002DBDB4DF|nr:hypothetical protein [Paenibacillus chitinolyticus]MEC0247436.1 hypothetical protein [Paenibacillus chitinolyticus]
MTIIPIISRQIAFAKFEGQTGEFSVYYHTGKVENYTGFDLEDIQALWDSANRYDTLMRLTESRRFPQTTPT